MEETSARRGPPVEPDLMRRYLRPGPRYTSYPTVVEFGPKFSEREYRSKLWEANQAASEPLSLYVHLPFCEARCTYCGCNVVVTRKRHVAARYLEYLQREIELLAERLPDRRTVSQYHWGGGTPTYHTLEELEALHGRITDHFEIADDAEVAVELDPRVTSREQLDLLERLGFNRISMGVQDFDPAVQATVNRNQTEAETRELYDYCRKLRFHSINLDLIYGLPLQTPGTFARTVDTVLALRPDRVALYSYAHVPWIKPHQRRIDPRSLPGPEVKLELFWRAREMFLDAGYVQIGMDHFALPDDELATAVAARRLHRNFMGYTVKMGSDVVAAGMSGISDVRGSFAQNPHKLSAYYRALDDARLPTERGYLLTQDDRIRREVITRLMCNFYLDVRELEDRLGVHFGMYFAEELDELEAPDGPAAHGLVEIDPDRIEVTDRGRLFIRNLCMVFDRYLRAERRAAQVFSQTV